ncbi:hypothetical protein Sta7437_1135 [Stanieria cyanosphaera PCC 7437]|uniref:Uncharacterized protein n=1 Tax=Stanieria cyanosphaera (strain ATCC 29371 / PCC 7437) TaxID=111780 RepID=K9XQB5_STAC7|nr:hypothetical protein [Stanieria cyanosphaera]AFZ34708.1 hypothetical protein Sta7437_1135 [Stanieria cyanosphaera PCC 7437]
MNKLKSYYNSEGKTYLVEVKLSSISQLFNSFDPSPFIEKDLDDEVENYIVQSVREFSINTPLKLIFYLPPEKQDEAKQILPEAIHHYFDYRKQNSEKELRTILRQGRTSLIIGLVFLFTCISTTEFTNWLASGPLTHIFQEGLVIIGWVAMWRPIEIFLYDWWSIKNNQKLYDKLSQITIEIKQNKEEKVSIKSQSKEILPL